MALIAAVIVLLVLISSVDGRGTDTLIKSENTWALEDCKTGNFDLLLVADPSVVSSFDYSENATNVSRNRQMYIFSQVIDMFASPTEEILDGLKVSLMIAKTEKCEDYIDVRIELGSITNKTQLINRILDEKMRFEQFTNPMGAFENYVSQNGTINQLRANATLVVIMFGGHDNENVSYSLDYLRELMNISFGEFDAKLFMIVVKDEPPNTLDINNDTAVYKISVIEDNLLNTMSTLMCNECYRDWFGASFEPLKKDSYVFTSSCYRLGGISEVAVSWLSASATCWDYDRNSYLAALETESKLLSLSAQLIPKFENLRRTNNNIGSVAIYIGLQRLYSTVGRGFQWLSQNPLIYSNWNDSQPLGGLTLRCVMWVLPNFTEIVNASEYLHNNTIIKGTWSTVGCGDRKTPFYVCESTVKVKLASHVSNHSILNAANHTEMQNVNSIGEIGYISKSKNIMSLSVLLKYWKSDDKLSDSIAYIKDNITPNQLYSLNSVKLFQCDGSDGNFPYTSVCDFINDCPDRSDEMYCRKCKANEVRCKISNQCVPKHNWCDLYNDCRDGIDEQDCFTCSHGLCSDGRCLLKHFFADGEIDCFQCDSDDNISFEMNFVQQNNISGCLFTCNRTECIYQHMLGDGILDCRGIEGPIDETVGKLANTTCYDESDIAASKLSNWGPKCFYILDIYREPLGCRNRKHLLDCESFECPEGYYKCSNSYCIPTHYIGDGFHDCPFGEDEDFDMLDLDCQNYFRCQFRSYPGNLGLCLHPNLVCDTRKDCPDGDDELNCNLPCPDGFLCLAGTTVVNNITKVTNFSVKSIDRNTRYLDLSNVNLTNLFPAQFLMYFLNLNDAKMSNCGINNTKMPATMCSLGTVRQLDLSYNNITVIGSANIFWCIRNLYSLNLSHNALLYRFENNDNNLMRLERLDLSNTRIKTLMWGTFKALDDIKYLNLQNTGINNMSFLPHTTIHYLDLRGTPANNDPYASMFQDVILTTTFMTDSFKLCCPQLHNSRTNVSACFSVQDPFSSCSDLMSSTILLVILWTDGVLAVLGNVAVIIYRLFFDRRIFKMAHGHFVTHLSISDFLMGVYLLIIAVADRVYRDEFLWNENSWRHSAMCNLAGFLSTLSIEVSTIFIFLITLDRYLVIRFPFGQFRITGRVAAVFCAGTWIIGAVIAVLPLLPIFEHLKVYNTNSMCLGLPLTNNPRSGREFAISVFIFFNFAMFILIAFGQMAIYKTVCIMRISQGSLTNVNCRRAQDLTLAKKLALVVVTDFLCWFPIGVLGIMTLCGYRIGVEAYAWLAVLVLPINSAINPLLYTIPMVIGKVSMYAERMTERSKQQ